jgi:hypothetical protein
MLNDIAFQFLIFGILFWCILLETLNINFRPNKKMGLYLFRLGPVFATSRLKTAPDLTVANPRPRIYKYCKANQPAGQTQTQPPGERFPSSSRLVHAPSSLLKLGFFRLFCSLSCLSGLLFAFSDGSFALRWRLKNTFVLLKLQCGRTIWRPELRGFGLTRPIFGFFWCALLVLHLEL